MVFTQFYSFSHTRSLYVKVLIANKAGDDCTYSCLFPPQLCFMEARHCLSAANVIFGQTGKISTTEDSKFVCACFITQLLENIFKSF